MFSCNGRISSKQMGRMLSLAIFASGVFVLPYLSARIYGRSVLSGLLLFLAMAACYIGVFHLIGEKSSRENRGKSEGLRRGIVVIQALRQIVHLSFYIILSMEILGETKVPFMQGSSTNSLWNLLMISPLLLVAVYGANHGVEKLGRLHEVIYWVIFVPFFVMLLFGLKEVDYSIFVPHIEMPVWKMLLFSYGLLTFLVPAEQYLFLHPHLKPHREAEGFALKNWRGFWENHRCKSYFRLTGAVFLSVVLTLFILGIYGINGAGGDSMATVSIMRFIRLPLGVLERFDVLMVWFFMMGCFVLICGHLFFCGHLLMQLNVGKRLWWLLSATGLALLLVLLLPDYEEVVRLYAWYGAVADVPLSVLIPLFGSPIVTAGQTVREEVAK